MKLVMSDLATQWAEKDILKLRWIETAEELWALRVEASICESGSWSGGQGKGHRARLAVVGDRMWEEMGMLVPCTAAGNWLTLRRTVPEAAGGPEGSSEEQQGVVPYWEAAPATAPSQASLYGHQQGPILVPPRGVAPSSSWGQSPL